MNRFFAIAVLALVALPVFGQKWSRYTVTTEPAYDLYLNGTTTNGLGVTVADKGDNATVTVSNLFRVVHPTVWTPQSLSFSGTNSTINGRAGNIWNITLTNNLKLFATNFPAGYRGYVNITENSVGNFIVYFDSTNIKTNGGLLTTNANSRTVLEFRTDGTGTNLLVNHLTNFN